MLTPMKAIRAKCLDCCCGNMSEVSRCSIEKCSLHPYRFGKNPNRAGKGGNIANLSRGKPTQPTEKDENHVAEGEGIS